MLAEWQRVQAEISAFTRVCSYDRAGYGHSDAGPLPRTSSQISSELHDLLREAGERPPFILVGHSFGGYNVRVFNGHYPSEVAGMVLADAPQEDEYELFPPAWKQFSADLLNRWEGQARWMPLQITFGIARLKYGRLLGKDAYLILQAKYLQARASELKEIQVSAAQARLSGALGDKPLIVLTAVKQDDALKNAVSPDDFAHFQEIWVRILQPRLVQLSSRGKQVTLSDVGHDIPGEHPEAIVDAVREIYDETSSPPIR
jgi:pimeloyl-ACP methyl ester carboxylesterase